MTEGMGAGMTEGVVAVHDEKTARRRFSLQQTPPGQRTRRRATSDSAPRPASIMA